MNFKRASWTDAEDALMRAEYKRIGSVAIMQLIPGRTRKAIEQRAVGLGISSSRCRPWTDEEDAMLLKSWPTMGVRCVRLFPDRTKTSVQTRARKMRIECVLARKPKAKPEPVETVKTERIIFGEPLIEVSTDKRQTRSCFGYIDGRRVASVFQLAQVEAA